MIEDEISQAVAKALRVLHAACLRYSQQFDPDNGHQVGVYVYAVRSKGVTAPAVDRAAKKALLEMRDWPTAGQFADLVAVCERDLFAEKVSRYVCAVDEDGTEMMADPSRVRAGRLLPPGDYSGDGSPAPALPSPSRTPARARRLADVIIGKDGPGRRGMVRARDA